MESVIVTSGPLATVTVNRPEVRNALNSATIAALDRAFRRLEADPAVRVAILRGAGEEAFCAGADLREVAGAAADLLATRAYFSGLAELFATLAAVRFPVIAAVRGYALAGGCGLAAACDVTLAADNAVFGLPEVRVGLFPLVIMAPIFRAVGRKKGWALMLTGERIDAHEAEAIGLVTRVVPAAELDVATQRLAERIAGHNPDALALGREAFHTLPGLDYTEALRYLRDMITQAALTPGARQGIDAFLHRKESR